MYILYHLSEFTQLVPISKIAFKFEENQFTRRKSVYTKEIDMFEDLELHSMHKKSTKQNLGNILHFITIFPLQNIKKIQVITLTTISNCYFSGGLIV